MLEIYYIYVLLTAMYEENHPWFFWVNITWYSIATNGKLYEQITYGIAVNMVADAYSLGECLKPLLH